MKRIFGFASKHTTACLLVAAGMLTAAVMPVLSQTTPDQNAGATATKEEVRLLRSELIETRSELSQTRAEIKQLAAELAALRRDFSARIPTNQEPSYGGASFPSAADLARQTQPVPQATSESLSALSDEQKLLAARVEEQHQTKVESDSKYRVRISGLILMNAFSNRKAFDVADLPKLAMYSEFSGSVGASVRQSYLGLQVFGPSLAGASTSASISADFFGGFPEQQPYGTTLGLLRLRQASGHLDWANTSLVVGQETLFFSLLSPTSYASIAEPAMSYSGNLWTWTPQVAVEHRFHTSEQTYLGLSGGVLAPLTDNLNTVIYGPNVGPGNRSRRPAFAAQLTFNTKRFDQPVSIGIGGYGSHLTYDPGRETDSWAVTSFLRVPLLSKLELSGEAYRGKAVGGLGGGIWQSVVFDTDPESATAHLRPLNAFGGWTQLKFHPHPKWELNSAIGQDNVFASDLEWTPTPVGLYTIPLARNRAAFGNFILRPRSNLLLSLEYRKIWTYRYDGVRNTADQVNIGAGVSF